MEILQNSIYFIVFIGSLVLFHELGHFLVAKACNVKVLSFSIGFGPQIISFKHGETEYRIGLLPLGGYVKMVGEMPGMDIEPEDVDRALNSKPLWQRTMVVAAGPIANFLLAFVVYLYMFTGVQSFNDTKLGIVNVGQPAWNAGLRPGDRLLEINGQKIEKWSELATLIGDRPGETIRIVYERDDERYVAEIRTEAKNELDMFKESQSRGRIGVSLNYVLPWVGVVDPDSPAALAGIQTGDKIVQIGAKKVAAWHEIRQALRAYRSGRAITISLERNGNPLSVQLTPSATFPDGLLESLLFSSADVPGGYTGLVSQDVIVDKVESGTPAATAGLAVGDRLLAVSMETEGTEQRRTIGVWAMDLAALQGMDARNKFKLEYQRGREIIEKTVRLEAVEHTDELKNKSTQYVFGATNVSGSLKAYKFEEDVSIMDASMRATRQVQLDMTLIAKGIYKLIEGKVPLDSVGGPIMLFVIAEKSAKRGMDTFLRMLAVISVNLGLLNLLPIPVLDGGHLLMYAVEFIRHEPPSMRFREISNMIGIAVLLLLMVVVFSNDIIRFIIN